ncbi:hypothetical protein PENSPDRAFT_759995 [Peniophora sp. CONT]|nr:hypothetical protein PENSPDRAFT_759995 [Peniophora sp. CONT]
MERSSQDRFRASVESALMCRVQDIGSDLEVARAQEKPKSTVLDQTSEDIVYLSSLVTDYTRHLNRLRSPLLRLPPEILPTVLNVVVSDTRPHLRGWIHLGHVCNVLRSVLLGMHALWADVVCDVQYAHVQKELLVRAGSCPILISLPHNPAPQHIVKALGLLNRAHSFGILSVPREKMDTIVEALGQGPFQSLERLSLCLSDTAISYKGHSPLVAPKLRALHLQNMILPIKSSTLTSLSLCLRYVHIPMQGARAFVGMLRRCAQLEDLKLDGWIPDCAVLQHEQQYESVVSLPRLVRITMRHGCTRILQFWSLLSIPTSTSVDLQFTDDPSNLQGLLEKSRTLRAFIWTG